MENLGLRVDFGKLRGLNGKLTGIFIIGELFL
jgi:hypothetical protein